jgi:hypothetical protein
MDGKPTPEQKLRRGLAHAALGGLGPAQWDGQVFTDEELAEHWQTWASESHALGQAGWDDTTYAYWRFLRGLDVDQAVVEADKARRHRTRATTGASHPR